LIDLVLQHWSVMTVLPLDEIRKAHERIETRPIAGKIALQVV
jgi:hypothetical protein